LSNLNASKLSNAERLQLLVDAVVEYAIYMLDLDGRVVSWNAGAERLKKYTAQEIIGQHFERFYTQEDRTAGLPQNALATARTTGRFHAEGWRVRKDGSKFWAMVVIDAIRDQTGALVGYAKVTRDITKKQLAEQEVLEGERRYRRLIEAVIDYAIFQLDVSGHVATWNPGAQKIKGYAPQEIIGKHFSSFYTPEDVAAGVPQRALETAATEGKYEAEGWRVRKDGSRFFASVVIDAIRDGNNAVIGFAKVTRDVTERHEAQQKLRETQEQLLASQKMEAIGQLSGGIAHDFNNLMMIVIGNLETLQHEIVKAPTNARMSRAVSNAMRGAQRASALTSRLLAFSRRQPLDPKPLDLNKFLTGSADFVQRSLGENIRIETVGAPGLWSVEVDANHLESALLNLAINARDAMPSGGKLTIESANVYADGDYSRRNPEVPVGQYVCVSITDTGSGMPPEIINRAFEPFFTTKELGHGTGLGLSQVYGFVKQSGGHVKIYSEVGQGTTVRLYFPRWRGSTEIDQDEMEPILEGEESEVILIAEDDADLRAYVTDILSGLRYKVLQAPNAAGALDFIRSDTKIDLLLTDVIMPGMNGRELAKIASQNRPDMPVLYMTGYSRNAVVHQGRLDDGVDFLQKPVSQAELATRVRVALDRGRKKQSE
jgi:PAS domain S-box-containing protein